MATIHNTRLIKPRKFDWIFKYFIAHNNSLLYYQLKSAKHYDEPALQRVLLYKLKEILPEYFVIYYNKDIVSQLNPFDKCKPDFLLWDKDYTIWYLIEVELENHHLAHIKKQINTFYDGDYSNASGIAKYVKKYAAECDEARLVNLISSKRPKIILLADDIKCEWIEEFSTQGILFSTLQVYSDENDNFLYRIGGDLPQQYSIFSYCTLNKRLRALDISSPEFLRKLKYKSGNKVTIYYKGIADYWEYLEAQETTTLIYLADFMPLDITTNRWMIILNKKNQLHLIKS